jgi:hypothetical protein
MRVTKNLLPAMLIALFFVGVGLAGIPDDYDENGGLTGTVTPPEAQATVNVISGGDVVASVEADPSTGAFEISDLPAGTYDIEVIPGAENYDIAEVTDVAVDAGESTDVGNISLAPIDDGWLE